MARCLRRAAGPALALCRTADLDAARRAGLEPVLCPVLDGMAAEDAALLAALPIADANALLIDAVARMTSARADARFPMPRAAAFFAADPFLHLGDLLERLRRAGIKTLLNFPSVQVFDGAFGDSLDRVGCGTTLELERLVQAQSAGFGICALIKSAALMPRLQKAGIRTYALLPTAGPDQHPTGGEAGDPTTAVRSAAGRRPASLRRLTVEIFRA